MNETSLNIRYCFQFESIQDNKPNPERTPPHNSNNNNSDDDKCIMSRKLAVYANAIATQFFEAQLT